MAAAMFGNQKYAGLGTSDKVIRVFEVFLKQSARLAGRLLDQREITSLFTTVPCRW